MLIHIFLLNFESLKHYEPNSDQKAFNCLILSNYFAVSILLCIMVTNSQEKTSAFVIGYKWHSQCNVNESNVKKKNIKK